MRAYYVTLERKLRVIAIRQSAEDQVGKCSDYQIIFCAAACGRIRQSKATLEDLSDEDLFDLYEWIVVTERFSTYA
jgi:hypothetical protein